MVFKKLLGALGVGGPSVDTVLHDGPVVPGGTLAGEVRLRGGGADVEVEHLALELVARVEAEHEDGEAEGFVAFEGFVVGGAFRLAEEEERTVPFSCTLPWETPVNELHGQPLGVVLGVRTELAVDGARDKGDLDELRVGPLPVQEAVLESLGRLGFAFASADLELGRIHGTGQQLPFYQEIELTPPERWAHAFGEIEVSFLADPAGMEVVLEGDRRGGLGFGGDTVRRYTVSHSDVASLDWDAEVEGWIAALAEGHAAAGYGGYGYGGHGKQEAFAGERDSGPGMGAVVAGAAAGVAVGAVGAYAVSEMLDDDSDDDSDEESDEAGDDGGEDGGDEE